jgi:hypothetical protein
MIQRQKPDITDPALGGHGQELNWKAASGLDQIPGMLSNEFTGMICDAVSEAPAGKHP